MNKNTIMSAVVVLLFGVSGAVIYYGIFSKPSASTLPIEANQRNIVNLLPYGDDLNFKILEDRSGVLPPYVYKKVNPGQDVGLQPKDMLKNAAPDVSGSSPNQVF